MLESIVSHGLALGAVYALIGIAYNVMFSASRVFSFTAGMVGMLGGVFGALFALPIAAALVSIVKELRVELPGEVALDPALREADARAEQTYARRTEGASPTEAAQTALDVAERSKPRRKRG